MIGVMMLIGLFFLGFMTGVTSMLYFILYVGKKFSSKVKSESNKPSLEERMKRVKVITDEQVELSRRADGPQKNSLDGKYKNSLIGQIKSLDEEKNSILQSILSDGHDPELKTIDGSGVVARMKLSEYMAMMGYGAQKPTAPPTKPSGPERMGKFTVYRGGKDDEDGGNNTSH